MIFEVELTDQADYDLRGIYDYIADELQSPLNAHDQLDRLEKSIRSLVQFPERFRKYEEEPWYSRGLRVMVVDNYVVFYIPNMKSQIVTVIRVMSSKRDTAHQLHTHTEF